MPVVDPEGLVQAEDEKRTARDRLFRMMRALREPAAVVLGVITVFWRIALTNQYTFLASPDLVNMIVPRLQPVIYAIRHWSIMLWNPYELFGQPMIGMVQPGVTSPFTFLLAAAPLDHGQVQFFYINLWLVAIHCLAGLFAWRFFRELGCSAGPAIFGGILFTTMGYYGNTEWPNNLQPAIMTPLVFLFLLRSLRGRAPLKNAAWAGSMLGISWLCGHHDPPLMLSLAVAGIGIAAAIPRANRRQAALRMLVLFAAEGLVAAVQILPALEYGKLSTRWTESVTTTWGSTVPFQDHVDLGLTPPDLIHVLIPGGRGTYSEPFVGIVALTLAAIAVWAGFRRKEVRLFAVLSVAALLYTLAGSDVLYGLFYALVPTVEKAREPIVALFLFHFAVAALAAMGAEMVISDRDRLGDSRIARMLVWLGGAILVFYFVLSSFRPLGDDRPIMVGFVALLLAAALQAWRLNFVRREWAMLPVCLLMMIEQGTEVGWGWARVTDANRMAMVNILTDTRDLADWLHRQPNPKRIGKNDQEVTFNFGDWYRFDSAYAYGASMLTATQQLGGWWNERIGRMYGLNYTLSRKSPRSGLQDVFTGKSGIKIWYDPGAFPRAWTVHQTVTAKDEASAVDMLNNGTFDLRTTVLTVGSKPDLSPCTGADKVTYIDDRTQSLQVNVEMACTGLLVVSDNWYPGWKAEVDGKSVDILKVNTVIRGVIVPAGKHVVTMEYRPFSVYFGFFCTLMGLAGAVVLQRRREKDGSDLL